MGKPERDRARWETVWLVKFNLLIRTCIPTQAVLVLNSVGFTNTR